MAADPVNKVDPQGLWWDWMGSRDNFMVDVGIGHGRGGGGGPCNDKKEKLVGYAGPRSTGSPSNNPSIDNSLGSVTGTEVCAWLGVLTAGANYITNSNINYNFLGPNSNSAAGYLLGLLPVDVIDQPIPISLVGFGISLP